jgi:hypothetical protein
MSRKKVVTLQEVRAQGQSKWHEASSIDGRQTAAVNTQQALDVQIWTNKMSQKK